MMRHIRSYRFALAASAAAIGLAPFSLAVAQEKAPAGEVLEAQPRAEAVDPVAESVAFTKKLTADATAALLQEDVSENEKLAAFQSVLSEGLAVDSIGRFMIGEARKTMSPEQTERYEAIFPTYITRLYAEQFADIVGRPLEVVDTKTINRRDVIVRTRFNREDGGPINVDWRVRKLKSGEHKAIDIIVSGVSIMLVKREEFSAFVKQNGVDALIDKLEADAAS